MLCENDIGMSVNVAGLQAQSCNKAYIATPSSGLLEGVLGHTKTQVWWRWK